MMDQVYPFNGEKAVVINPRTGSPGILELVSLGIGEQRVFLFKGTMSQAECEDAINANGRATYKVAANKYSRGTIAWDGDQSTFTVFCEEACRGYVRISEVVACGCKG